MIYNFDFTLQLSYLFFNWDLSCRTSDFSSTIWSFFQHHSRLRGHISNEFRKDLELASPRSVWWGIWLSVSITWLQAKPTSSAEIEDFFHSRWIASSREKCWFQAKRPILSLEPDLDLDWGFLQNNRGKRLQNNRGKRLKKIPTNFQWVS